MQTTSAAISVSTPGRVCVFGEHQDNLGLPVIPSAVSPRITMETRRRIDREIRIDLPDIGSREEFSPGDPLAYIRERDYCRSAVNVLRRSVPGLPHRAADRWEVPSGLFHLRRGSHKFSVTVVTMGRQAGLDLHIKGPGLELQAIPASMLWRRPR